MLKNKLAVFISMALPFSFGVYAAEQTPVSPDQVLTVTSTADDGSAGTLRWALEKITLILAITGLKLP